MLKQLKARSSIRDKDQEPRENEQWFRISPQSSGVSSHPQPLKIRTLLRELKDGCKNTQDLRREKKKYIYIYDQKTPQPTQSTYGQTTDLQFQTAFLPESSTYYLIWSSLRESPKPSRLQKRPLKLYSEHFSALKVCVKCWQTNSTFVHCRLFL